MTTKESIREKLLSRQFGAAVSFFIVTSCLLMWLLHKCKSEPFDHVSAINYVQWYTEANLWNFAVFITGDTGKKVVQLMTVRKGGQVQ